MTHYKSWRRIYKKSPNLRMAVESYKKTDLAENQLKKLL